MATKAQVTKAVEGTLWVKVNPTDGKMTFRLSEPENNVLYTLLTQAKTTRVVNAVFNNSNPKDYTYILTTIVDGNREHQGVRFGNQLHEKLLGIVLTQAKAKELRSNIEANKPKARTGGAKTTKRTVKAARKGSGRKGRRNNKRQTTAPAAGGSEDTMAEIKALMEQMVAKLS